MRKLSLSSIPFEKIGRIGRLQRLLICAGTFLVLTGAFLFLIYLPKTKAIQELKSNHELLEIKLVKVRAAAKNLRRFQRQCKEAEAKFELALSLLPDKKEIPGLLEAISKSGKDSGLEFLLFQPGKEVLKDFYAEIPVTIQVCGGYHNLAMFFGRVATLSRIVNISSLSMKATKQSGERLSASCVATTYRFLEASEIKAIAEAKKKKKKKRKK
ncbi:MAG: protein PilO [Deltaproteobacteria bacterium]|nr:MAG: protein PilO [Deltaproteobacteria bacterium]